MNFFSLPEMKQFLTSPALSLVTVKMSQHGSNSKNSTETATVTMIPLWGITITWYMLVFHNLTSKKLYVELI